MADQTQDLNQVITSAVQARIEAQVLAALSSDETFARFVQAALQQPVEKERYSSQKVTWLAKVLEGAVQVATRQAVARVMEEMQPQIEDEVRRALRRDIKGIAASLVSSVTHAVKQPYGITITLKERGE